MSVGCGARVRPMALPLSILPRAIPAISATAAVAVRLTWLRATRCQTAADASQEAATAAATVLMQLLMIRRTQRGAMRRVE